MYEAIKTFASEKVRITEKDLKSKLDQLVLYRVEDADGLINNLTSIFDKLGGCQTKLKNEDKNIFLQKAISKCNRLSNVVNLITIAPTVAFTVTSNMLLKEMNIAKESCAKIFSNIPSTGTYLYGILVVLLSNSWQILQVLQYSLMSL